MRMLVLGAGMQGSACAYDLLSKTHHEVVLADLHPDHLPSFLQPYQGSERLTLVRLDAQDRAAVRGVMKGAAAVMSAFPYYLNLGMAVVAVESGAHFCDLGGNTEIVLRQKQLHQRARQRGVSVIADCGLAPGMVNILAGHGIRQLDRPTAVYIKVGGLPQNPQPPLMEFPGVGPVLSRTLSAALPELGTLGPKQIASLVGVAPHARDSGTLRGRRTVWGGRAEVRQALYMGALVAARHNPHIRTFYHRLLARGKEKKRALVACMRKLLRILNAMLKHQQPWNPALAAASA